MSNARACEIREASLVDVPAIARLTAEFAQYMLGRGEATELRLNGDALERDGFGPAPAFQGLVAEMAGSVVGYLLFHEGYDSDGACRVMFVADLFVTREVRRYGVGAALMHHVSRIAGRRGAKQLVWTVDHHNTEAQQFYERIGGQFVHGLCLMCLDI
jgi:GNAT superfamily N-acetyltransferase